jgi:hypothetical protein
MESRESDTEPGHGRYRALEYSGPDGVVTIIQDHRNDNAWIQSDHTVEVRR